MYKKFLGIQMTKRLYALVVSATVFFVIFLAGYIGLGFFVSKQEVQVYMPQNGLTDSIFDAQNMVYTKNNNFTEKHSFKYNPFTIDMLSGQKAVVGDSTTVNVQGYYFYLSEIASEADVTNRVKKDLISIIDFSTSIKDCYASILFSEDGYMNGCRGTFYVMEIGVDNNFKDIKKYLVLYRLNTDESIFVSDVDMLIGCMVDTYSTQSLADAEELARILVNTLNLDEKALKAIKENEEQGVFEKPADDVIGTEISSEMLSGNTSNEPVIANIPTAYPVSGSVIVSEERDDDGNPVCVYSLIKGDMIYPAADGVVTYIGTTEAGLTEVIIDHQNGYTTYYKNSGTCEAAVGDNIKDFNTLFAIADDSSKLYYQVMKDGEFIKPLTLSEVTP